MRRAAPITLVLTLALAGCPTTERRAEGPVSASTYEPGTARPADSVGRLARLAVMNVTLHRAAVPEDAGGAELRGLDDEARREIQALVGRYLREQKGYDTVAVNESIPTDERTMAEAGRRLNVDGVVAVERWVANVMSTAEGTGWFMMNLLLLNIPLFATLNEPNLRISIHEAATGRMVWQMTRNGRQFRGSLSEKEVAEVLRNLENAVPAQLRRRQAP